MSIIFCESSDCQHNYGGECLEVSRAQIHITSCRTCANYKLERKDIYNIKDRVSRLCKSMERDLLRTDAPIDKALLQGEVNALETVLHIINDEGRK